MKKFGHSARYAKLFKDSKTKFFIEMLMIYAKGLRKCCECSPTMGKKLKKSFLKVAPET